MRAVLLHLDDAMTNQVRLRKAVVSGGGRLLDYRDIGPALRLWSRPLALDRLRARLAAALPPAFGPALVFSGSGDFHHVTPLLIARALAASDAPAVTVLHFDNHPDWVRFGPGAHCGSWVGDAARLTGVAKVLTIGVCSPDIDRPERKGADLSLVEDGRVELYAYRAPGSASHVRLCGREWPTIEAMGEAAFVAYLAARIDTDALYVTIDKDVLRPAEAGTNWDQGLASLALVQAIIDRAAQGRRLIGADVVGDWSRAAFGGGPLQRLLKSGEAVLDQPWRAPPPERCAANEPVNLEILRQFRELAA